MKLFKLTALIGLLCSVSLSCATANAQARGNEGGGGDVVLLPDDTVVLADPWIDTGAPQPNNMPPMRALNPRILQLSSLYLSATSNILNDFSPSKQNSEIVREISKLSTRANSLRFYAVQDQAELNSFCASGGRKIYKLPEGHVVNQVACTAGDETFFVEPLFLRLTLRDQVLLLFHERLTTFRDKLGGKNYSAIARLTTGLSVYLNLYKKEAKGIFSVITEEDAKKLTEMFIAAEEIQFRDSDPTLESFQWSAHTNGGGRVHSGSSIDPAALVSLRSIVPEGSILAANSKVINSKSAAALQLDEKAIIDSTDIFSNGYEKIILAKNTKIVKSSIKGNLELAEGAIVDWSSLSSTVGENKVLGKNAQIIKSTINGNLELGEGAIVDGSNFLSGNKVLSKNTKIVKSSISGSFELREGSIVDGSNISGTSLLIGQNSNIVKSSININSYLTIGSNQTLENGIISTETMKNFFPLDKISPLPINLEWSEDGVLFDGTKGYNGSAYSKKDVKDLYDSYNKGSGLKIATSIDRAGLLSNKYKLNIDYTLNFSSVMNADPKYYVVEDGIIYKAGFTKFVLITLADSKAFASILSGLEKIFLARKLNFYKVQADTYALEFATSK
jgi:hypothetical protein